jgi:purine-binding chemotaxis protein CheW
MGITAAEQPQLVFAAGGRRYTVSTESVREVVRLPQLTQVPLAPPALLGLGSFRGEVLAVLSLGQRNTVGEARQALILAGAMRIAIAVDKVERFGTAAANSEVEPLAIENFIQSALPPRTAALRRGRAQRETTLAGGEERLGLLRFSVGEQFFGLPLEDIEAVMVAPDDVARLPDADPAAVGTCRYKDRLLGLVSMATLLGFPTSASARPMVVIARIGQHRAGLIVDRIDGVLRLGSSQIDALPTTLDRGAGEARISAIGRPEDGTLISLLATNALLNDSQTQRLLGTGSRSGPEITSTGSAATASHLLFRVGDHELAFPVAAVDKISLLPRRVTRIPGAPASILGVAMINGMLTPIVDQGHRLTAKKAVGRQRRVIVVKLGDAIAGFLVDRVTGLAAASAEMLSPAPLPDDLAQGVFGDVLLMPQDDMSVLVLTPEALLDTVERDLLERHKSHVSAADA